MLAKYTWFTVYNGKMKRRMEEICFDACLKSCQPSEDYITVKKYIIPREYLQ